MKGCHSDQQTENASLPVAPLSAFREKNLGSLALLAEANKSMSGVKNAEHNAANVSSLSCQSVTLEKLRDYKSAASLSSPAM
jgi:hypothetical protein